MSLDYDQQQRDRHSRFANNSEAFASELLKIFQETFHSNYMRSSVIAGSNIQSLVTRLEIVNPYTLYNIILQSEKTLIIWNSWNK